MINPREYLKDPEKFGDVVIMSAEEFEDMQLLENAGLSENDKRYTHKEVFDELKGRVDELKAQRK